MSKAQVLVKGDTDWLKTLTVGTPLYTAEYQSEPNEVVLHKFIFEGYDANAVKRPDSDTIYANLKLENAPNVKMAAINIAYGYFRTPMEAIESFTDTIETILKASNEALKKERRRMEKVAAKLRAEMKNQNKGD